MKTKKKKKRRSDKAAFANPDFEIGGGWGNAIEWAGPEQFDEKELSPDNEFKVYGFKLRKPKVGETLKGEFRKSWMLFEFVKIEPCGDPHDMFFATVKPIAQLPK